MKTYFIVENIEKPLKAISSYKSEELVELCERMKIPLETEKNGEKKKPTKQFMYEKLIQLLS